MKGVAASRKENAKMGIWRDGQARRAPFAHKMAQLLSLLALFGCTSGSAGNAGETSIREAAGMAESAYPASITYWVGMNDNVSATMSSFNEMGVYRELEARTGTKVLFEHPPAAQANNQFQLMMASGKWPDVIEHYWGTVAKGPDHAIKDNRILRLNELIEQHAPNLAKLLAEHPDFRKQITTDEGNIYVFPGLSGDESTLVFNGPALRQDWLDKLELPIPVTIREWENVLTAFRDRDPNGNGKRDEIPLLFDLRVMDACHAFIGAFGITSSFYQEAGVIRYGPMQPQFKDLLALLHRWYNEGLIDRDFATNDQQVKDAKMAAGLVGAMAMNIGAGIGTYTTAGTAVDPAFRLVAAPYPSLEPGGVSIGQKTHAFIGRGAAISAKSEHPEQIARWLDYAYGPEGHMLFNFGMEGVSYTKRNGYPVFSERITHNPDNLSVTYAMTRYSHGTFSGPFVSDGRFAEQYAALPEQKRAREVWSKADHAKLLPLISQTPEESAALSAIMADINAYYYEMVNKFIMGLLPLSEFDSFVSTLRTMGIDQAIAFKQAALDRYNNR